MPTKPTAEAVKQYLASPYHCPFCGSGNVEADSTQITDLEAEQGIRCLRCAQEWIDVYKLDRIVIDGDGLGDDHPLPLTPRELATVLAALQYWQNDLDDDTEMENEIIDGAHFQEHSPLSSAEIDALCERLNR